MKRPARMTQNPAKWWLNSLSFLSARSLAGSVSSICICSSIAIDMPSCPLWLEGAEGSCAEACEMLNTSTAPKRAPATDSLRSADLLRKIMIAPYDRGNLRQGASAPRDTNQHFL